MLLASVKKDSIYSGPHLLGADQLFFEVTATT